MKAYILTILYACTCYLGYTQETTFRVAVYDKLSHEPLTGAQVRLQDMASLREYKMAANDSGLTTFTLKPGERYRLEVSARPLTTGEGYLNYTCMLSGKELVSKKLLPVELEKVKQAESGILPAIHFNYNQTGLSAVNKTTLDNLSAMMEGFPSLQIEIGLYADCREEEQIIKKRAQAIAEYLTAKGVSTRAVVKEYGNVRALNACNCASKTYLCPEEKYAENRRAEFKVLAF